jgi:type I restriction enzyme S subunit
VNYIPYSLRKHSGQDWLGEVPDHWDVLSIKRLTPVSRGASPRPIEDPKFFDEEGEYAWVRIADVTSNHHYLRETTQRLSELGKSLSVALEPGSLFLSIAGSVGKPMITAIKACIHDGFVYFPQLQINFEFLYYIFDSGQPYLGLGKFGTQLNLNTDTVGGIKIGLPPCSEQQKIAAFLDWKTGQIDGLIEKNKELLEKLKEKRIAVITQAVTKGLNPDAAMRDSGIPWLGKLPVHWEVKKLKFSVSKVGSGVTPKGGAESYEKEGIPLFRSQNIHFDGLRLDDIVFISEETHHGMINSKISAGDVLLNITGASIGRCNYVPADFGEGNVNQHVCIIRPEAEILTKYLQMVLCSKVGQSQIDLEQSGSGREGLTFVAIKNFVIPLPATEEQGNIVRQIDLHLGRVETLIQKVEHVVTNLTEYRTALITAATTGKIDVRLVNIPENHLKA